MTSAGPCLDFQQKAFTFRRQGLSNAGVSNYRPVLIKCSRKAVTLEPEIYFLFTFCQHVHLKKQVNLEGFCEVKGRCLLSYL